MNALWQKVNREMVAKILAELEYERTLRAEPAGGQLAHQYGQRVLAVSRHAWDMGLAAY